MVVFTVAAFIKKTVIEATLSEDEGVPFTCFYQMKMPSGESWYIVFSAKEEKATLWRMYTLKISTLTLH